MITESLTPCEDCGGVVIVGPEPVDLTIEDGLLPGQTTQLVDFCTNANCPSNELRGLTRVGVNLYVCTVCGEELSGPISEIFAHRQAH